MCDMTEKGMLVTLGESLQVVLKLQCTQDFLRVPAAHADTLQTYNFRRSRGEPWESAFKCC